MRSTLVPLLLAALLTAGPALADAAAPVDAPVRIGEHTIYSFRESLNDVAPAVRARRASVALEAALAAPPVPIRVQLEEPLAVLLAGETPLLQLGPADALAAGDANLQVHAESVRTAIESTLTSERSRRSIANVVFSLSLVVFAAMVMLLLARRLSDLGRRALSSLDKNPDVLKPLTIGGLEVLGGPTLRGLGTSAVTLGFPLFTGLLAVAWLLFSLSLFDLTRPIGDRLSGALFGPIGEAFARLGAGFPIAVLVVTFGFVVAVLLRFVGLYFASVERGEVELPGVGPARAPAVGFLVRVGLLVLSVLVAGPLLAGEDAWLLRWAGAALVAAVALASVPVLANVAAGLPVLFGRHLAVGDRVSFGPNPNDVGVVREVGLAGTVVRLRDGSLRRLPHLRSLVHDTSTWPAGEPATFELLLDAKVPAGRVLKLLEATLKASAAEGTASLVEVDADAARYVVAATMAPGHEDLLGALSDALVREGLAFRRLRRVGA